MATSAGRRIIPMQRRGGLVTDMVDLPADEITVELVAHALSHKNRFTGHALVPYNVAQHCVLGSQQIAGPFKLPFLLHELDEVFLQDIHGPLKPKVFVEIGSLTSPQLISWSALGAAHAKVILSALGLTSLAPLIESDEVKAMDWRMLRTERDQLMDQPRPTEGADWWFPDGTEPIEGLKIFDMCTDPWPAYKAEKEFLSQYERLVSK